MRTYVQAFIALSPMSAINAYAFEISDWGFWITVLAMIWAVVIYPEAAAWNRRTPAPALEEKKE